MTIEESYFTLPFSVLPHINNFCTLLADFAKSPRNSSSIEFLHARSTYHLYGLTFKFRKSANIIMENMYVLSVFHFHPNGIVPLGGGDGAGNGMPG